MARRTKKITSKFGIATAKFFTEKRIAMGLTQSDVSEVIYGTRSRRNVICDIENHMKQMNSNIIDKYCEYFNCDVVFKEEIL